MSDQAAPAGLTVAVVGATGAVGADLLATLHRSALPVAELRLLASPASAGRTLEVNERTHRVHALTGDPSEAPSLEGVDLVFLAVPPERARELGPAIAETGAMVIEIGGALADRAPLVVPAVSMHALPEAARARLVCSPSAPAVVIATVLGALRELSPIAVRGTCLLSAGAAGVAGIEELSGQVVSMFNHKDPPRRVFPTGLAFDLHPAVGATGPSAQDGWTEAERRIASEVSVLSDIPPSRVAVALALAPLFSGVAANLQIELEHEAPLEEIRTRLGDGRTVRLSEPLPGPRRLVGRSGLYVGRVRADPSGSGVHLWAIADNLRFAASGNAIAIATALWRDGLL